ncbi:uncharacterized protein J3D65DRAFT_635369 [Phyllosticta citribraziliensis]|uniref:Uncharacterized protein n=1 Tax=Phyllosticta citribraziliensis TaxID=989973 RepID=A0ABR1L9P6_9PEZI
MLADLAEPRPIQHLRPRPREWIPPWLRMTRTLPLALYCVVFALLLEILDVEVRRNEGLAADAKHTSSVNAARYIPTVGIVVLGFACKSIASDAKKITPWSTMSRRWSKSSNSVALDYVNSTEAFTVVPSLRRRHWAVFTGLVVGFVCGALVAVANSLTYVNLFASSTQPATFDKATTFRFEEALETANHSLAIPYTSQGQQPYAAVVAEELPNGQAAAWTLDSYVFESFTNTSQMPENGTMEAPTKAIFPNWSCHPIDMTVGEDPENSYMLLFTAKTSEQPELNCSRDTVMEYSTGSDGNDVVLGWLNVTACGDDESDLRLVSTLARRTNITQADDSDTTFNTTMVSAMCSSSFTIQDATVRVNQSTGEVLDYTLGASPSPVDIQTSMAAQYIYLNNPLDGRSQKVFALNDVGFTYNVEPQANLSVITEAASYFLSNYKLDPFTSSITDNEVALNIESFLSDPERLTGAVEQQANAIMAQITNSLARANTTGPVEGKIRTDGPKLFLRQISLRALQAFLLAIAVACVLQSTLFRPKTILREDPGSIAAQAVVLASSPEAVERLFAREAVSSESHMRHGLASKIWSLQPSPNGGVMLQAAKQEDQPVNAVPSQSPGVYSHDGFRPLALQFWAKWGVIAATLAVMAALAALMALSQVHDGICADTAAASDAFAFVPTVVFLVLGYASSGLDAAVRVMAPYKNLWNGYSGKKQPLLSSLSSAPSVLAPFRAVKNRLGLTVAASSFVILFIPAIKIVAAGLYGVALVQRSQSIDALVDMTFVDHVQDTFGLAVDTAAQSYSVYDRMAANLSMDLQANIQTASQFTEWTMYPDFNIPVQAGILDNLVFSNLTSVSVDSDLSAAAEVTVNVPAIAVDVTCKSADVGVSAYRQNCSDGSPYFTFYGHCATAACNATMNMTDSGTGYISFTSRFQSESSCDGRHNRYQGSTFLRYDMGYQVILGDLGPAQGYVANVSDFGNTTVPVEAAMFNVSSLPTIRAAVCYSNFSVVRVDATYSRRSSTSGGNSTASSQSWNPIRYDRASLRTTQQIDNPPYWLAPLAKTKATDHFNQYDVSTDTPGLLDAPTLWPTRGSSTSFFELLASYAENDDTDGGGGDLTRLLQDAFMLRAAEEVYESYATNMLTLLRPWARAASASPSSSSSPNSSSSSTTPLPATLTSPQPRIHQSLASTIALETLLALMLLCFVCVALFYPSDAILPKDPGCVAATASLLAGSRFVRGLRGAEGVGLGSIGDLARGRAGLGWWPVVEKKDGGSDGSDAAAEGEGEGEVEEWDRPLAGAQGGLRWGIDIGDDVVRGSWRERPAFRDVKGAEV